VVKNIATIFIRQTPWHGACKHMSLQADIIHVLATALPCVAAGGIGMALRNSMCTEVDGIVRV
jgi:hypothetical protein